MRKQLIFAGLCLALHTHPCLAYNPETDSPKLEELAAHYKESTSIYKSALEKKKDYVEEQIRNTKEAIVTEADTQKRRELADLWENLTNQLNDLSDKIRIINAGEVVKLSNTKDKLVAFLTQ